jgi:hypothetical protein
MPNVRAVSAILLVQIIKNVSMKPAALDAKKIKIANT